MGTVWSRDRSLAGGWQAHPFQSMALTKDDHLETGDHFFDFAASVLLPGLSEASGVKLSWVEVSKESPKIAKNKSGKSACQGPIKDI